MLLHRQQASALLHKMGGFDMSAHMVGFNVKVANSVREKGGQWGLALLREDCMEFMTPDQFIKEITGVMNELWFIVHGSIIHPKKASIQCQLELPMRETNAVRIKSETLVQIYSRIKGGAEH